jgi:hypothetical protein
MSTEEQARELMTQHRHHDEQLKESMLNRAEAEVDDPTSADSLTQKHARELVAQQRHNDQELQEAMLSRAKDGITISNDTSDTSST